MSVSYASLGDTRLPRPALQRRSPDREARLTGVSVWGQELRRSASAFGASHGDVGSISVSVWGQELRRRASVFGAGNCDTERQRLGRETATQCVSV